MSNCLFALSLTLLTLTGCGGRNYHYSITKTEVSAEAKTCTFVVEYPEDYAGSERGTQTVTVTPMTTEEWESYKNGSHPLGGSKFEAAGIGLTFRRTCAGYFPLNTAPRKE